MPATAHLPSLVREGRCHRASEQPIPEAVSLVFDDVRDEDAVVQRLSSAYGPGHELVCMRRRLRTWLAGGREISLSATPSSLVLSVGRAG